MKKILLFFLFCFVFLNPIFSSPLDFAIGIIDTTQKIKEDTKNQRYPYYNDLKLEINNLDLNADINLFYNENKIPTLMPTVKALLLGFGSGSKAQGKAVSQNIYFLCDTTIIGAGISIALIYGFTEGFFGSVSNTSSDYSYFTTALIYTAVIEAISHTIQALDAVIYSNIYNAKLRHDLNLIANINPNDLSVSLGYKVKLS